MNPTGNVLAHKLIGLGVAVLFAVALFLALPPQVSGAGTSCINTFHWHDVGLGYYHQRSYVYPSGSGWNWGWENQHGAYIGTIWCGTQNP